MTASVPKHPAGTPCWFDLTSDDPGVATTFYAGLFGWAFGEGSGPMRYQMASLDGESVAGVGQRPSAAPFPACWTVYFASEDLEASCARIVEAGGEVAMGPLSVGPAGSMAVGIDPTGAAFGLWQPGEHHGSAWIGKAGSMAWCEVNTKDAERAKAFYERVLGLHGKSLPMATTTYFTLEDDQPRCGILQMTAEWGDMPPHWMTYFAVENADASAAKVAELGGKVAHGPFDTPFGRIAVVQDPSGVAFSLVQPAAREG